MRYVIPQMACRRIDMCRLAKEKNGHKRNETPQKSLQSLDKWSRSMVAKSPALLIVVVRQGMIPHAKKSLWWVDEVHALLTPLLVADKNTKYTIRYSESQRIKRCSAHLDWMPSSRWQHMRDFQVRFWGRFSLSSWGAPIGTHWHARDTSTTLWLYCHNYCNE